MKGKKIGVYGLGASGASTCAALAAAGAQVFSWDENPGARAKTENTEYAAEHPKSWPWKELSSLVLSPGVPLTHPKPHPVVKKARLERVEIIGDVELFARFINRLPDDARPRVVCVTGSNGKSTTTALTGHILKDAGIKVAVGGNIGQPVLSLPALSAGGAYVLELSSFQLDLTASLRPDVSMLLNISPDHIDRHGDIDGYVAAKKRIFRNQQGGNYAIIGVDDAWSQSVCAELAAANGPRVVQVSARGSLGSGVFGLSGQLYYNLDGKSGSAGDISAIGSLKGEHNWQNAAAALAAAMIMGVAPKVAIRSMERFEGLPHRMESVARVGDVTFINDSKATNAEAAARALCSFENIFWIAGGRAKEGGVESLRGLMSRVRCAYLIGEAAGQLEAQLAGAAPCVRCGDLGAAVARAGRDAAQCGAPAVVLLSPACASYDQFRNFEHRGEEFRALAQKAANSAGEAA